MRIPPPQLLLLGSIASVQFGSAFADKLFAQARPGGVVLLRLALSGAMLLAISRPRLRGRTRADLRAAIAFGLVLGGMNWSFYEALDRLPLGVAVTIEFLGPLTVAVAGSRRLLDAVWVVLAAGGVGLLALRGDNHDIDPVGIAQGGTALLHPGVLAGGLAVALLSSLIPYSLEIVALRRLKASTFGLLMSLEPAFAALAGVIVLSQHLTGILLIALVMVVTASVGTTVTGRAVGSAGNEPQLSA